MTTYWVSLTYTADGWRGLLSAGAEQRQAAVGAVLEQLGIELDGMWWDLERHVLHLLVRADDAAALSGLAVFDLATSVAASIEIRTLLSAPQLTEALARARNLQAWLEAKTQ